MTSFGFGLALNQRRPRRPPASAPVAPSTDPAITAVNAEGWSVSYTNPPVMKPSYAPRYIVANRQGYNSSGQLINFEEALILTKRVRQPYPNQATLHPSRVALSDYIYSSDSIAGVTNNSTEISPKPICNWVMADRALVGNSLRLELVAFHRNARFREQVACVEFIASDGTNTVTAKVSVSSILGGAGDVLPVIGYTATLDISTLSAGLITVNAKVYPFVGAAASIADSSTSSVAREFSPRYYRKDAALAASPVLVYVNASTGNDTTGAVSTNAATAEAAPCLTVGGAINRAIAVNGSLDGVVIRCMAGTHTLSSSAIVATRAQTSGELVITRDPNATKAGVVLQFGTAAFRPRLGAAGGWLRFRGVTLQRTGTLTFNGEASSALLLTFEDIAYDGGNHSATLYSNSDGRWLGVVATNPGANTFSAATREHRLIRGLDITGSGAVEDWLIVGSRFINPTGGLTRGTRSQSGAIHAFNRVQGMSPTNGWVSIGASADVVGYGLVQNILEYLSATSAAIVRISADDATGSTTHVVMHHNTIIGFNDRGRCNLFYDDGATPRTNELMSLVGNIHCQLNHKGDVFISDGTRVGNWAFLYGVGCRGEFSMFVDAQGEGLGGSFAQAYPGLRALPGTSTTRNDPLFVDYKGTVSNSVAGAGGGNYALNDNSPAKARLFGKECVLRFDFTGQDRTLSTAAGASVPVSGDADIVAPAGSGVLVVTDDVTYTRAHSIATEGQIIEIADGAVLGATLLKQPGATLRGASLNHTIRSLAVQDAPGATVTRVNIQPNTTPAGGPLLLSMQGNMDGVLITGNRIRGGNPWNSFADFDPTVTDTAANAMGSQATGWSATNRYNDLWYGIGAVGAPTGTITIQVNDISDVREGIKFSYGGNGGLAILGNNLTRCYQDAISVGLPNSAGPISLLHINGNVISDLFAQPQDNANPHGDAIQFFTDDIGPDTYNHPIPNAEICGNILFQRPGSRGQPQVLFASDFMDGYPFVAPLVADNLMLTRITSTGLIMRAQDNGPPGTGAVWGLFTRNFILANAGNNTRIQNELTANSVSGIPAAVESAMLRIDVLSDPTYGPPTPANYIRSNFSEQTTANEGSLFVGNVATGRGSVADAYSTWFDLPAGSASWAAFWSGLTNEDRVIALAKATKTAHQAINPVPAGISSGAAFRARWSGPVASRPYGELQSAVGWIALTGQATSTLVTSGWAFVHAGGPGATRALSGSGGEYRTADDRLGTNATAWAPLPASGGSIAHGRYMQVRTTTSGSAATAVTVNVTVGAESFSWSATTA